MRLVCRHQKPSRRRVVVPRFLDASHLKVHQDAHRRSGGKETQAIGLTRIGANNKLHALVVGRLRLLRATVTAGQVSDMKIGPEHIRGLRHCSIVADKGYHSGLIRETARQHIKRQHRLASRYDELAEMFFNFILLASTLDWLRS